MIESENKSDLPERGSLEKGATEGATSGKESSSARSRSPAQVREQGLFKARDGTSIYYEIRGQGKPLVLCYGLTCRIEHWSHQIDYFSRSYQVICLDYRGHHRSSMPHNTSNLTVQWCANDVEDLVDHLGLSRVVCLGHSLGVPVVGLVARDIPEKVAACVMICGSMRKPFEHMFYSNKLDPVFRFTSKLYGMAPDVVSRLWFKLTEVNRLNHFLISRLGFNARLSGHKDIQKYLEGVHRAPFKLFHHLLGNYNDFDGRDCLRELRCPTLILTGEKDYITPMYLQEEMVRLIPLGEYECFPEGSHNVHIDFAAQVNQMIEKFLCRNRY